jgi:hypothetical protein
MATLVKNFADKPVRVSFDDGLERLAENLLVAIEEQCAAERPFDMELVSDSDGHS